MVIKKFNDFLLESLFIMSDNMCDIMTELSKLDDSTAEIASCFLDLYSKDIDMSMSYLELGDDNITIKFRDGNKADDIRKKTGASISNIFDGVSSNPVRVGKLVRKVVDAHNKRNSENIVFNDSEIEEFVNYWKSSWDINNNRMNSLHLVKGDAIYDAYLMSNYFRQIGKLGKSCMKYDECQDYLEIYTKNSNVECLVLKSLDGKISGRALIWTLVNGNKFMDRIYTNFDSDIRLFHIWAKSNNYIIRANDNFDCDLFLTSEDGWGTPKYVTLESKFRPVHGSEVILFPYSDTLKFFYWKTGILKNHIDNSGFYISLTDTDGSPVCEKCDGDGEAVCVCIVGDEECESCRNSVLSKNSCDMCGGDGYIECKKCGGSSRIVCDRCGGFCGEYH